MTAQCSDEPDAGCVTSTLWIVNPATSPRLPFRLTLRRSTATTLSINDSRYGRSFLASCNHSEVNTKDWTRRQSPCSSCEKRFPGIRPPDICCAIEMPSTEQTSPPRPQIGKRRKCLLRPGRPGKIPMPNAWWAPSDASAWTTWFCGTRDRYAEPCTAILPTTTTLHTAHLAM